MKKLIVLLGVVFITGLFVVQGFAWMPGGGKSLQTWDRAPGYGMRDSRGYYANLTDEQEEKLNSLHQQFYNETQPLVNDLRTKSTELGNLLSAENPDVEKAKALQKEISDIRAKLDEKRLEYWIEAGKIAPDVNMSRRYDFAPGIPMMRNYGPGMGFDGPMMRNHGPGMRFDGPMTRNYGPGMGHDTPRGGYGPSTRW